MDDMRSSVRAGPSCRTADDAIRDGAVDDKNTGACADEADDNGNIATGGTGGLGAASGGDGTSTGRDDIGVSVGDGFTAGGADGVGDGTTAVCCAGADGVGDGNSEGGAGAKGALGGTAGVKVSIPSASGVSLHQ